MSPAKIIDGKIISAIVKESLRPRILTLKERGIIPGLAVILVGDNPASQVYVGMKEKAFREMEMFSQTYHLPANTSQQSLKTLIEQLNGDNRFHGILVQIPLPAPLDANEAILQISPDKDADGLHPTNIGRMVLGMTAPLPCTPHGILMMLKYSGIDPSGKHVVVIGRSNIVGKPIANLLLQKRELGNATVTLCHTQTHDIQAICRQADILIAAIGKAEFVDKSFVKPGCVVIDVGVNRVKDETTAKGYRLVGDVKYSEVSEIAEAITPVPGGVGVMTISMLLSNTVYLAEQSLFRR
ncbi:MAG: bifunctional methylenetetrahydrofolate dehydrogenase/methenyltetrahydrofolate cyclohydrolase FolD [Candidatus Marinimicrobia bacterium CG08_land_8_20_14_0_20_45_22]|nr:MAG: bifunctional methylenetetrahydrofolate dehydrogenase/methenyltetrahydrofolate cyclohydrolase FolD [Candidatus Marinimicrobia bacterium CG08_land_8_20_14_0_20_45_22]